MADLSTGVAGGYTAKLLGDFGADVVKVEPPGGDPIRLAGPFPDDRVDPDQGALHLHLHTNRRSVVADLDSETGRELLRSLVPTVDVVVESFAPGQLDAWGLGVAELEALRPGLVVTSLSPFGQTGPYRDHAGEEIVAYAMGGPMHATGTAEREPVKMGGNVIQYQHGNVAALATVAALAVAEADGGAVHVDVANLETQVGSIDRRTTYLLYHSFTGRIAPRETSNLQRATPIGYFPTSDGWALCFTIPSWIPRMLEALEEPELARRYADPGWMTDEELPDLVDAVVYPWFAERTKAQAAAEAQAHRWPVTPLNEPVDLLDDPHFAARGFFVDVDHPATGGHRQPGAPFRLAGDGWSLRRPAPLLGQHDEEVRAELASPDLVRARPGSSGARPLERRLPLEGIRVLDLTVVWAGPYATMFLGDLGAEVIRVDNPWVFPTATRGTLPRPPAALVPEMGPLQSYPDDDPGERPWNRHSMFAAHARNKLGITLDLRTELGRLTFMRLVERADVVVENNSVGVLDKLGLGWEVLSARNPRLVLVRMPPLGFTGPYKDWAGFGAHFEGLCGLTAIRGYPDLDPTSAGTVFHMDAATGAGGALATLLALRQRDQTGEGQRVEFPQCENMLQHVGEYLVDGARTGRRHGPIGNRHPVHAPQGCYRCAPSPMPGAPNGAELVDDRWAVISVTSDEAWAGLRRALGDPPWAADERFATAAGRRAHHDELDRRLSAWTATLDRHEVFRRCQAEGVAAAPVLDEADCYADAHLAARGGFRENGSEDLGRHRFPSHLWRWDGPELAWGPISRLGVDNDYVYREVLGLDDEAYRALADGGHLSLDYLQADGTPF